MNADEKRLMMRLLQREYINDIPGEEKVCACGCRLKRVGENSKKRLRIIISKCMQLDMYIQNMHIRMEALQGMDLLN